jgi:hypothetical protein
LPSELIKSIRRGYARGKNTLLNCFELNKEPNFNNKDEELVGRRGRSKPRSSDKHRRRKIGEDRMNGLSGLENIGYTLDKLQEVDGQNEVLHFEK